MSPDPSQVVALRKQLWAAGFRPVALYNIDQEATLGGATIEERSRGKVPLGSAWQEQARLSPPAAAKGFPDHRALNTGILADGLQPIDVDIDDPALANTVRNIAVERFGEAPMRVRGSGARCLLLYRAPPGMEPAKRAKAGPHGKVEVLGRGQQLQAFGTHYTGAELSWTSGAPGDVTLDQLPIARFEDVAQFLQDIAPLLGVDEAATPKVNGHANGTHSASRHGLTASIFDISAAVRSIPNTGAADWEGWNRVGMALWAATDGGETGREMWHAWSSAHPSYDQVATNERWDHYRTSPPTHIGAGTLFHAAKPPAPSESDYGTHIPLAGHRDTLDVPVVVETEQSVEFPATEFLASELLNIPPRRWVYGHFLIRKFLSVLGAPGGTGKTAYAFAVAMSVILGRSLLGETVHDAGNVWIYNLEDPRDELLRRLQAVLLHYEVDPDEIQGKLFLDSGRERPLIVASLRSDGAIVISPIVEALTEELKRRNVCLLIVDPVIKSHRLEENSNEQIDVAVSLWNQVADEADCCVLLLSHFRKGGISGEASAFRGASALIDGARAAVSLSTMTKEEADHLGVDEVARRFHVRADNAKLNLAPPPDDTTWLRLTNVELPNGDNVQTVARWAPTSPFDGIPMPIVVRIMDVLSKGPSSGEQFTAAGNGADKARWAGSVVMREAGKTPGQAKQILRTWLENGLVEKTIYHSPEARKDRAGLSVNDVKISEMRHPTHATEDA